MTPPGLVAVIVLYKRPLADAPTFVSLRRAIAAAGTGAGLHLLVYDNSPEPQTIPALPCEVRYHHDAENPGLGAAYNLAHAWARQIDAGWLLLLDQDSDLPDDYLGVFAGTVAKLSDDFVAAVPKVWVGARQYSPQNVVAGVAPGMLPVRQREGLAAREITAINSGAFVRRSFLDEIDGFSLDFPLEFLDHWLFSEIHRRGKNVFLLDARLTHDLALARFKSAVGVDRYRRIVDAEVRFYKSRRGRVSAAVYSAVLATRVAKLAVLGNPPAFWFATLKGAAALARHALVGGSPD